MFRYYLIAILGLGTHGATLAAGSADAGMTVFTQQCSDCHSIDAGVHRKGPSLANVYGGPAGAVEGFDYSYELKNEDFDWTDTTLYEYLTIPTQSGGGDQLLHSVNMHFDGVSGDSAEDVIAFLKRLRE